MNMKTLEKTRKKYKNTILISVIIYIISLAVPMILRADTIVILNLIGGLVIIALITRNPKTNYSNAYKEYFVETNLKKLFTDLKYEPNTEMPFNVIAETKMMNMGSEYSSNDFISGKYKNIGFSQADICIEQRYQTVDSDGNSRTVYVTIFKGRWMIFNFNKQFKANVQVVQKGFKNNTVKLRGLFTKKDDKSGYEKVEMESAKFNKKFVVYAQNEHEAFYILTPSLMEKIEKLDDDNSGKIMLCFINNKLHIGLYDNKDSFEAPNCFFKIKEEKEIEKTTRDIKIITQFVDELNLDNELFKKSSDLEENINKRKID